MSGIDEHALLVAIRQNARIARLAEPLRTYEVGRRVSEVFHHFILALQMLSLNTVGVAAVVFDWFDIIIGLRSEE